MSESFAELFEKSMEQVQFYPGAIVKGTIIDITDNYVLVDAGFKSEAVIPVEQFHNMKGELEIAIGDAVDVSLDTVEDGYGETRLSREKAKRVKAWEELERVQKEGKIISGFVSGRVKGGFTVEIDGGVLRGFLPGSLVDVRPVRDASYIEGKDVELKVIKLDQKRNNIVLSRKAVLEAESHEERAALLDRIEEGQTIKGIVKNLTDYGAFVDLGGIDGLLHVTDMAWKRVKHPSEVVTVGDEIEVKVLQLDRDKDRVSLGLKQLAEDPWKGIERRYPVNSRIFGKVSNITDYGCFVEVEDGVEGLVHISEMDWTNKNINPNKVVKLGDEIEVMVLEVNEARRRISMGIKQCQDNPWTSFANKHAKGEKITGKIKSITDFGVFIGLDGDIDGLVHLSDLSWDTSGEEAVREYSKGQELETIILAIDPERERISLGVKQLEDTPLSKFLIENEKGSVVSGTVTEVDDAKAVVDLGNDVQGHIAANQITRGKVESAHEHLSVGDTVEAQIIGVDNKTRVINLSTKVTEGKEKKAKKKPVATTAPAEPVVSATLGDLLKEKLDSKDETTGE